MKVTKAVGNFPNLFANYNKSFRNTTLPAGLQTYGNIVLSGDLREWVSPTTTSATVFKIVAVLYLTYSGNNAPYIVTNEILLTAATIRSLASGVTVTGGIKRHYLNPSWSSTLANNSIIEWYLTYNSSSGLGYQLDNRGPYKDSIRRSFITFYLDKIYYPGSALPVSEIGDIIIEENQNNVMELIIPNEIENKEIKERGFKKWKSWFKNLKQNPEK